MEAAYFGRSRKSSLDITRGAREVRSRPVSGLRVELSYCKGSLEKLGLTPHERRWGLVGYGV